MAAMRGNAAAHRDERVTGHFALRHVALNTRRCAVARHVAQVVVDAGDAVVLARALVLDDRLLAAVVAVAFDEPAEVGDALVVVDVREHGVQAALPRAAHVLAQPLPEVGLSPHALALVAHPCLVVRDGEVDDVDPGHG